MSVGTLPQTEQLLEITMSTSIKVDPAAGVIRGVRILGPRSRNGRQYAADAMIGARDLYEGSVVNYDHPNRSDPGAPRSVNDRAGWLENVRFEAGGLTGDLNLLMSDPRAKKLCEAAERRPELFGLSHNIDGKVRRRDGNTLVEEITLVRSVDVVSDPASTRSLFEGMEDYDSGRSIDGRDFFDKVACPTNSFGIVESRGHRRKELQKKFANSERKSRDAKSKDAKDRQSRSKDAKDFFSRVTC